MTMQKRGFTLIELLVVIAIIGILSSVVLASLNTAREKSRDAKRVSDIKQLQLALELYYDSVTPHEYPDTTEGLAILETNGFIATVPTDPTSGANYFYEPYTASTISSLNSCGTGQACVYYQLGANLENDTHSALSADLDSTADAIDGDDVDACDTTADRFCYDVAP